VLLLASNSPRRWKLLSLGGWMFTTVVSHVDEDQLPGEPPTEYVLRLAEAKARAVAGEAQDRSIIIGADTTVVDGMELLGKPRDAAEAAAMLKRLRGHAHQVYTGIAVLRPSDGKLVTDLCVTEVPMRNYSDEEIEAYVLTGDPLDKAGAYAIQHPGFQPVERMEGCFASVMGLPLCHLVRTLRQFEVASLAEVPVRCQEFLDYACPVSSAILRGEKVG
jgi:MAF protein